MSRAVGLVDVDNTLTYDCAIRPDRSMEEFHQEMAIPGKINLALIHALRLSGINDIYLYTSMVAAEKHFLNHRLALIEILEKQYGFTVHGVITPSDCAWGIPEERIQQVLSNEEICATYSPFVHSYNLPLLEVIRLHHEYRTAYQKQFPDFMQSSDILESSRSEHVGISFREAVAAMDNEQFDAITGRYTNNRRFTHMQSDVDFKAGSKALMYQLFEKHNTRFDACFIFDDLAQNLEYVVQIQNAIEDDQDVLDVNTIHVHPHHGFNRYYSLITLKLATVEYLTHLEELNNDKVDHELLIQKRELVEACDYLLEPSFEQIYDAHKTSRFLNKYKDNRELILQNATPGCVKFVKNIDEIANQQFTQRLFIKAAVELQKVAFDKTQYDESLKTIGKTIYHKLISTRFLSIKDYLRAIELAEVIKQGILHPEDSHNFARCQRLTVDFNKTKDWNYINGMLTAFTGALLLAASITLSLCSNGMLIPATAPAFTLGKALLLTGILSCGYLSLDISYSAFNFFEKSQYGLAKEVTLFGNTLKSEKGQNTKLDQALCSNSNDDVIHSVATKSIACHA